MLHYLGYDADGGGIVSVVRALESAGQFECLLGVNPGFSQRRVPPLAALTLPAIDGETISPWTMWRARAVARAAREWLQADPRRIFHGHSRAGLLTAVWLARWGGQRVVASVHCYGRHRWFYRWAARQLGDRLFWLSPAMKRHYGVADAESWQQCVPGCVPAATTEQNPRRTLPAGVVRLGGVGALVEWKRWHLVIEAIARLPAPVRTRVHFAHIGEPLADKASLEYAADLRRQTQALALGHAVEWRGEQAGAGPLLREIDCLVVASRHEPLSIALLEALQAGVPVLAARSGGNCDIVAPPRLGWFFEPDDVHDLARKMTMLVETDALARVDIRREDLARFEAAAIAARWAEIYERLGASE